MMKTRKVGAGLLEKGDVVTLWEPDSFFSIIIASETDAYGNIVYRDIMYDFGQGGMFFDEWSYESSKIANIIFDSRKYMEKSK